MGVQDRDWYKEHIRRKDRESHSPPSFGGRGFRVRGLNPLITLVLCLVLFLGIATAVTRRAPSASGSGIPVNEASRAESQRQVQQQPVDGVTRQERQQALIDQEQAHLRAIAERDQIADEARRASTKGDDRKAIAWAKYYRSPPGCDAAATVECVNDRIRAKRVFEAEFAKGRL